MSDGHDYRTTQRTFVLGVAGIVVTGFGLLYFTDQGTPEAIMFAALGLVGVVFVISTLQKMKREVKNRG